MSQSWSIRPANQTDWRALRLLLPHAVHFGAGVRVLVAKTDSGDSRVLGAAALTARPRAEPVPGLRLSIHVIPPARRQGIARTLFNACVAIAAAEGLSALYAWGPVEPASTDSQAWKRLGMEHSCHVLETRTDLAASIRYLQPIYQQVVQRGWVPAGARLVPLDRADPAGIAQLHVQHLGGDFDTLLRRLGGQTPPPYHPEMSPVILLDGRVAAFILTLPIGDGVGLIESTVVAPSVRGRWANLWMRVAGARRCLELGLHTVLYYTYDRHGDTRKVAQRLEGVTRQLIEPYRFLSAIPISAEPPPDGRADRTGGPI